MARKPGIRVTANFERNLESIEGFLRDVGASRCFDELLDALLESVIPNLERFPAIGVRLLAFESRSLESTIALEGLRGRVPDADLRQYVFDDYLLLYAHIDAVVYLLAIRHHRQLSFDLDGMWIKEQRAQYVMP